MKYVGTRTLDWSVDGQGNYWSDNTAFDLDGDGIADTAYRPNDVVDQLLWRAPSARILLNSPAVSVVRWAQSQFPAILPGGVVDSAPLMKPPGASNRSCNDFPSSRWPASASATARTMPCRTWTWTCGKANAWRWPATTAPARAR